METYIIEKFTSTTEYLTDEELKVCLAYYRQLLKALDICPLEYCLVRNDIRLKLDRLQGWDKARKEK